MKKFMEIYIPNKCLDTSGKGMAICESNLGIGTKPLTSVLSLQKNDATNLSVGPETQAKITTFSLLLQFLQL